MKNENRLKVFAVNIGRIYAWKLPSILIFIALTLLVIESVQSFSTGEGFREILTVYLTATGISLALGSVVMSYTKFLSGPDRKVVSQAAESFLYASVSLIEAILLSWLSFQAKNMIQKKESLKFLNYIFSLFFGWGQLYLTYAASNLYNGLMTLDKFLFHRLKHIL